MSSNSNCNGFHKHHYHHEDEDDNDSGDDLYVDEIQNEHDFHRSFHQEQEHRHNGTGIYMNGNGARHVAFMESRSNRKRRRIAIVFSGTRGDAQPYCALALELQSRGHKVLLVGSQDHAHLAHACGIRDYAPAFFHVMHSIWNNPDMLDGMSNGNLVTFVRGLDQVRRHATPQSAECLQQALLDFEPNLILTHFCHDGMVAALCEYVLGGIPWMSVNLQNFMPTRQQRAHNKKIKHLSSSVTGSTVEGNGSNAAAARQSSYLFSTIGMLGLAYARREENECYRKIFQINGSTKSTKKDKPKEKNSNTDHVVMPFDSLQSLMMEYAHPIAPPILACSTACSTCPPPSSYLGSYGQHLVYAGHFCIPRQLELEIPTLFGDWNEIQDFLNEDVNDKPIYMGWGSVMAISPEYMTCLAVSVLKECNLRGIILGSGLAQLNPSHLRQEPALWDYATSRTPTTQARRVLFCPHGAPHQNLFSHCRMVLHHGGSGTFFAALSAGVPSIITPVFTDQFVHAAFLNQCGAGLGLSQFQTMTRSDLVQAIKTILQNYSSFMGRARAMARSIQEQILDEGRGTTRAARVVEDFMDNRVDTGLWYRDWKRQVTVRTTRATMNNIFFFLCMLFFDMFSNNKNSTVAATHYHHSNNNKNDSDDDEEGTQDV